MALTAEHPYTEAGITERLANLTGWKFDRPNSRIEKTFVRKNFPDAVGFVGQIAQIAERHDHHPDILIFDYKNVKIMLSTHSSGGVTQKDFYLAAEIDKLK